MAEKIKTDVIVFYDYKQDKLREIDLNIHTTMKNLRLVYNRYINTLLDSENVTEDNFVFVGFYVLYKNADEILEDEF